MLLETRQNEANTTSVGQKYSGFNRLLLKKIGAKTNTFFSHCSGRNSLMYSIIALQMYRFYFLYPKITKEIILLYLLYLHTHVPQQCLIWGNDHVCGSFFTNQGVLHKIDESQFKVRVCDEIVND